MSTALQALIAAGVAAAVAGVVYWPGHGLLARWRRLRQRDERVLLEDALKYAFESAYRQQPCTLAGLAGTLAIPANEAARLLTLLQARGLLEAEGEDYRLTKPGREYAMRVVRAHRLWEYYLSKETGYEQLDWHREAERREHVLSPAETDALAARLGNPLYDPHGDPIPTATGEVAPRQSRSLTELPAGEVATIVHLEDEPAAVFSQLAEAGLNPGMKVQVEKVTPEQVRFRADGEGHLLPPVAAASVSVRALPEEQEMEGPFESLSALRRGERGSVSGLSRACRGLERHRLLDLGLVPGTVVEAEMAGLGGTLMAYRIRGALIALRKEQADHVHIRRDPKEARP